MSANDLPPDLLSGSIVDIFPAYGADYDEQGRPDQYTMVYVTEANERREVRVSRRAVEHVAQERGGKSGQGETHNAYIARIKTMSKTERTGTITDYLAHGPAGEGESTKAEPGVVRVPENYTAPTVKAKHERGILFQGPWETYADGFCEHTRRLARALSMTDGTPVHLRSILPRHRNPSGEDRVVDQQYADLLHASIAMYVGQIQMAVPTPGLLTRLVTSKYYTPEQVKYLNARRVISTVWERQSGLAADDKAALSVAGQLWVACPANKEFLAAEGVDEDKIRVIPCPYLEDDPHLELYGRQRRAGPTRFYHIGKWEPRKEQRRILLAFMRAFKPGQAMLLLKTSDKAPPFQGYPVSPDQAILQCLADAQVRARGWTADNVKNDIVIMARRLSNQQMIDLHRIGDVYVSLSRGEGYDMPAFDAKLSGNLLVYTPSGGPQSFAGQFDYKVEQTGLVPCHPFYGWPEGSQYLAYDVDDAVRALQAADEAARTLDDPEERRGWGPHDADFFSAEMVGELMLECLEEIMEL